MTAPASIALEECRARVRAKTGIDIATLGRWRAEIFERHSGKQAGQTYKEYIAPNGDRLRSVKEVEARAMQMRAKSASAGGGKKRRGEGGKGEARAKRAKAAASAAEETPEADLFAYVSSVAGKDISGDGWRVVVVDRGRNGGAKGTYKEYVAPGGHKLRSLKEVLTYLSLVDATGDGANGGVKGEDDGEKEPRPSREELEAMERKAAEEHAALITRAALETREQLAAPSVNVTGLEVDEDMDEDKLVVEFYRITGFEPSDYETVEQLRAKVNNARAQAAARANDVTPAFRFNPTERAPRTTLQALPNGPSSTREDEELRAAEQREFIMKMKAKYASNIDALGSVHNADWRGEGRVPTFLGNTSMPDVVRGGTRAGAAPQIAGTDAEIKLLPSVERTPLADVGDRPPFDPTDLQAVSTLKAAMHTSATPEETRCRDIERAKVIDLIHGCLRDHKPGSLYLAGLPGTGKTLTLRDVQKTTEKWGIAGKTRPRVTFINCMSVHDPKAIFGLILDQLNEKVLACDRDPAKESAEFSDVPEIMALRRVVTEMKGGMVIILLDEMDQLVTRAHDVLYELFALPAMTGSRCVLSGVSNALNLTDRVLPRLRARGCEPQLVTFPAYDGKQIKELLKQRLASLPFKAFEDSALELCSRKVGAATGDMRKALNVCATAIDICVQEATKSAGEDSEEAPATVKGIVKIAHMARALSKTFASPVVDSIRALPQMQQMVLCSAVKLFRNASTMETNMGALHDRYANVCKSAGVKELPLGEFYNMCTALGDHALLKVSNGNNDRMRKVKLLCTYDDVVFALQGVHFFRNLLGVSNE